MSEVQSQLSGQISGSAHTALEFDSSKGTVVASRQDSDEDEHKSTQLVSHKKYGNMKVFYDGRVLVSLGPDYMCFLSAFFTFSIVSYLVIALVQTSADSFLFKVCTYVVCIGQCVTYLLVAISDPGVVTESADGLAEGQKKQCLKCEMMVPRAVRHCRDCDVCVREYDHHCPWTSKCIGGNNLIRFYVFLGWTPLYLIYITVALVVCMSNNLINLKQMPK